MSKRHPISWTFSALGNPKARLLLLGPDSPFHEAIKIEASSFPIEHVSPAFLVQQEISRHTSLGQSAEAILRRSADLRGADQLTLAIMRKWFWARKPDAGFLLTGFPATLLQAKVFDEWLDARGETLTSVLADPTVSAALPADDVVTHYRTQGLLDGVVCAAA